jgi:hypothetical protein
MPTITWRALPRSRVWLLLLLVVGCAQQPAVEHKPVPPPPPELPALPATLINDPDCPGCLAVTVTLRPDGSYLVREQLGASEFYDFGRWRYAQGTLELAGDRGTRKHRLASFRKSGEVERLRGPFRMVGLYDGATFKECRTGAAWKFSDTNAAKTLSSEFAKTGEKAVLVAIDAQLEGSPETLRVFRSPALLDKKACP